MSNDKTSKDFELVELVKPLTEREMKETTGGVEMIIPMRGPEAIAAGRELANTTSPTTSPQPSSQPSSQQPSMGFGYTSETFKIPTRREIPTPLPRPTPLNRPTP